MQEFMLRLDLNTGVDLFFVNLKGVYLSLSV